MSNNPPACMVRVYAPFCIRGVWTWHPFSTREANVHAACADKASELGATTWDTSQASMMINGTCVAGHPTVFA